MTDLAKCDGCSKAYLPGGLIEFLDRGDCVTATAWLARADGHEVYLSITIAKNSLIVDSFVGLMKERTGLFCVGCAGPALLVALARTLNDTQIRGFHCIECEEGDLPA